jgi:hypothetical protein
MKFKNGDKAEGFCPKCGASLFYETSFRDCFSQRSGHYTVDVPIIACEKCDYAEEIEPEEMEV